MPTTTPKSRLDDGVIVAALPRSGTRSISAALQILGYNPFHTLDEEERGKGDEAWDKVRRTCWGNAPVLHRTYGLPPTPLWTREDWEAEYGEYDAITENPSLFALQLAKAYPKAKVVVVQRQKEQWMDGIKEIFFNQSPGPLFEAFIKYCVDPVLGKTPDRRARHDIYVAFTEATNDPDMLENLPKVYDRYFDDIRANVEPERRLSFQHADGWGPLCAFLGKPVPNVPYPRINERAGLIKGRKQAVRTMMMRWVARVSVFGVLPVALAVVAFTRRDLLGAYWRILKETAMVKLGR